MRHYYDIKLNDRTIAKRDLEGEAIVKAGRYLIAKTLLELGAATVDPLSPANPLIFSAGPFSGTSFRPSCSCIEEKREKSEDETPAPLSSNGVELAIGPNEVCQGTLKSRSKL